MHFPLVQFFEAAMLICFGCAWPVSIYKSYTSRSNKGKSIIFLYVILLGYLNGIIFQWLLERRWDYVFIIFFINSIMVAIDIAIFYRNKFLIQ